MTIDKYKWEPIPDGRCRREHVEQGHPWDVANFASICDDIRSTIEGLEYHTPFGVDRVSLGGGCVAALNRRLLMKRILKQFPKITFQDENGQPLVQTDRNRKQGRKAAREAGR